MSTVNNLLTKAVSSLYTPTDGGRIQNPAPPSLRPASSLVFLAPEFKLTEQEEAFLKVIIHRSKLAPNLTLFDLLFFDLHRELSNLSKFVRPEDFDETIKTLEVCYATLLKSESKDTAQLRKFLDGIILKFIVSNNKLNFPTPESSQKVKAVGDTKLITATLCERVQLFKKFEATPACHLQLFSHPLSTLVGTERLAANDQTELKDIFENNSSFLEIFFSSVRRTNPRLEALKEAFSELTKNVKSMGDCSPVGRKFDLLRFAQALLIFSPISPPLMKIFESVPVYGTILLESMKIFKSQDTEKTDLAVQQGRPPSMRDLRAGSSEPFDPKDKLAEFKADQLIEPYFHLTQAESDLIQELFNYPFDSDMTMFDILGFAFYDRLEKLKVINSRLNEKITETQGLISAYCLNLYIGLNRSEFQQVKSLGAVNAFSEKFAVFPHKFSNWIDTALDEFQWAVKNTQSNVKNPNKNAFEESKKKILNQFTKTVLPLRNLFIKLLQCKGHYNLLLRSAASYQGHEALDQQCDTARPLIKRYWDYVKTGYQTGIKAGLIGMGFNFDQVMRDDLPFSTPPLAKEMTTFGTNIVQNIFHMHQLFLMTKREGEEAIGGRLDHKTWLAKKGLRNVSEKNQQEFQEHLFSNHVLTVILRGFFSDMLRLVEKRVYPKETLTTQACFFRLRHNMCIKVKPADHRSSSLPSAIPSKFNTILAPIQAEFKKYPELFDFAFSDDDIQQGTFNHAKWLEYLFPIEASITSLLENSLKSLSLLKEELVQDLRNEWSVLSLEQLHKLDVPATKEALFQEGLKLMRPLLILSDMLALLQKRHYSEEAAIIPRELADVMELDGIDEMLQKLIKDKTPAPPREPSPPVVLEAPQPTVTEVKPSPTIPGVPEKKPILVKKPAASPITIPKSEIRELAYLTKSREILKKLREQDFFEVRKTGSHHILNGPQGGIVVVPQSNNLPRGTRNSIVEQVTQAMTPSLGK